jgi:hypothetical protein
VGQKERSPAAIASDNPPIPTNDQGSLNPFIETLASASQLSTSYSSSQIVRVRAAKRARRQPLPPQPLVEIAVGISGIVAKLKADREGTAQGARGEWSRLDAEVKELRESVETKLAASDRKTNRVLSILLRMEQQQSKERGVDT